MCDGGQLREHPYFASDGTAPFDFAALRAGALRPVWAPARPDKGATPKLDEYGEPLPPRVAEPPPAFNGDQSLFDDLF